MNRVTLTGMTLMVTSCAFAADLPAGDGRIEITQPGTYTAEADRTVGSLVIATPTGSDGSRVETVFDHTACPTRKLTFTGSNPQFDILNHYNTVYMKGGLWQFSGTLQLGMDANATAGRDAFRKLIISDGATVSGVTSAYVSYRQGGSELHVSNATFSASAMCVQGAASMGSDMAEQNRGKLIVGKNGKVRLSGDLTVQEGTETTNSRYTSLVRVSGEGAELSAAKVLMGDTPQTRASVGSEMVVDGGATVSFTDEFRLGVNPYVYNPDLFDTFRVTDSTFNGATLSSGYGAGVANEQIVFSNATVRTTGEFYAGYGDGSHDNMIGFYDCADIDLPAGKNWYAGRGKNSYNNKIIISNTVVRTSQEVAVGGAVDSHDNTVVLAGPSACVEMSGKQRDMFNYGRSNKFIVTDRASLSVTATSLFAFKYATDSELILEDGGQLTGSFVSVSMGRGNSGVTAGNAITVRNGGSVAIGGELNVYGSNNTLAIHNAEVSVDSTVTIGQTLTLGADSYMPAGCGLVVSGKSPKVTARKHVNFPAGAGSKLRFVIPQGGYVWPDEPGRTAPVVLAGEERFVLTIADDAVLEADVSAVAKEELGKLIPVISSTSPISISESALAAANARGEAADVRYSFHLSSDRKTLSVKAKANGLILVFR